tara:strand:+ start:320 stop:532 length:213 start_codon:yes stop_codon:yes gene_type:complete
MNYQNDKGSIQIPRSSYEKLQQVGTFPQPCGNGPNGPSCSCDMAYRTNFDKMMLQQWDPQYRKTSRSAKK